MSTATTITPKEAADLWEEAGYLTYEEEVTNRYAECANCGVQYKSHDEYGCFDDDDDDDDGELDEDEWCGFEASCSVDYISTVRLASGEVSNAFLKAFEASKHINIADMPPYDESERYNPWNALNDCLIADEFPEDTDEGTIEAAYAWVEAWKER